MDSRRRQLLIAAGTALAAPLARAQQSQKLRRIGILYLPPITAGDQKWWQDGLKIAGYEEGKNLVVEWRSAEADVERLPALAEELVRLRVELIIAFSRAAEEAAKQASSTIPIVVFASLFLAERGLIKSLARPGGNVTGTVWYLDPEVTFSKLYQILRDALPSASRVAFLRYAADPIFRFWDLALEYRLAKAQGFAVQDFPIQQPSELQAALDRVASSRPDALFVGGNVHQLGLSKVITEFAVRQKLVSYSDSPAYTFLGGLFFYGPNVRSVRELTLTYMDKILRGAKPADLPVQQSTQWELVLNAKTAQAIGFKPPPAFMLQVTRQIE